MVIKGCLTDESLGWARSTFRPVAAVIAPVKHDVGPLLHWRWAFSDLLVLLYELLDHRVLPADERLLTTLKDHPAAVTNTVLEIDLSDLANRHVDWVQSASGLLQTVVPNEVGTLCLLDVRKVLFSFHTLEEAVHAYSKLMGLPETSPCVSHNFTGGHLSSTAVSRWGLLRRRSVSPFLLLATERTLTEMGTVPKCRGEREVLLLLRRIECPLVPRITLHPQEWTNL
jgi:hypothetical protein